MLPHIYSMQNIMANSVCRCSCLQLLPEWQEEISSACDVWLQAHTVSWVLVNQSQCIHPQCCLAKSQHVLFSARWCGQQSSTWYHWRQLSNNGWKMLEFRSTHDPIEQCSQNSETCWWSGLTKDLVFTCKDSTTYQTSGSPVEGKFWSLSRETKHVQLQRRTSQRTTLSAWICYQCNHITVAYVRLCP